MRKYDSTLWGEAKFITEPFDFYGKNGKNPWQFGWGAEDQFADIPVGPGLPMLRRTFTAHKGDKGTLRFSALGCVELYLNGRRVSDDELKPGWSDYTKRSWAMACDVSALLCEGENCLLAVMTGGWYSGKIGLHTYGDHTPAALLHLTLEDASGAVSFVDSDADWQAKVGGPILAADIWDGERYDARQDCFCRISQASYDASDWGMATEADYFDGDVTMFVGPTIRVRPEMERGAASMWLYEGTKDNGTTYGEINLLCEPKDYPITVKKGQTLLIDTAQNMVGWARISVQGEAGATIRIRYAETTNDSGEAERGNDGPKGSAYTINYRTAKAKGHYTLRGCPEGETYRPTFTYYGFRLVELTADADFTLTGFGAEVVGSVTEEIGSIECSNPEVNQLISNVRWGQRGNYFGVPTDCPQRDERLGWTGDTQIFCRTAAYNADVDGFFHKWMQDMRDSQSAEGAYPDVAPRVSVVGDGAAAWADAGIIVPYQMYVMYGDTSLIEECYASMEKYMDFVASFGLNGPRAVYGDWLAYEGTDPAYISVVYYAYDATIMAEMSDAIGRHDRAEHYRALFAQIKAHFADQYMPEGELTQTSQSAYLLALRYNVLPESYREKAKKLLLEKIRANGCKLSSGFVGAGVFNHTLSELGEDNMAYSLLLQTENPSWLYSVRQGATTIWERWNSYTKATGFGDVGMNSFNHYAYGSVCEWMYRFMAGIETDGYGFAHVLLQPRVDTRTDDELPAGQERITWVKASYRSRAGLIESAWENHADGFVYRCTVPACGATLELPRMGGDSFTQNGEKHAMAEYPGSDKAVRIELPAGKYEFRIG